jgi:Ca2+-binding EF-hand superfamily protein
MVTPPLLKMSIDMPRKEFRDACRAIFDRIDTDFDGVLDQDEFKQFLAQVMRAFGLPQDDINNFTKFGKLDEGSVLFEAFAKIDADGDGILTWDEVWKGFEPLQKDLPGYLQSMAENCKLHRDMDEAEYNMMLKTMFDAADANQDGCLDLVEFKDFVTRTMIAAGVSEAECQRAQANGEVGLWTNLFEEIDFDGDKRLTFPEIQEMSSVLRERLPKEGGKLLYREMTIPDYEQALRELFGKHDANKDDKLDKVEFDNFMTNVCKAACLGDDVIEKGKAKQWLGMFPNLDFEDGKGHTW